MLNSRDMIIQDNLQCQFNPNSYKMIFVVNSENFIYLKGALQKARRVSSYAAVIHQNGSPVYMPVHFNNL